MGAQLTRRLITKGAKLPTQFHAYESTVDWFAMHKRNDPRYLGSGEVPYKGIGQA